MKLFRRLRQSLLTENKFSKYLIYAIGEIILVVIGILIALQINTWKEQERLHKNIKGIYAIVQSDLKEDIKKIDFIMELMSSRDSVFQAVLNDELSYEDYKSCLYCRRILDGFPDISLNHRGINLLNENLSSYRVDQDSLLTNLGEFYAYFNTEIEVALNEVTTDYSDNRYYFKNNMTWFEDYQNNIFNEEFARYAVDSQDYRNRVTSFYALFFKTYFAHLKDYKARALVIIDEIDKVII